MRIIAIVLASALCATSASAQQRPRAAPPAKVEPAKPEAPPEPPPAAYEPELLRLAEVLGTLSYMTALCEQPGSDSWQQRMAQLLEAEGSTVVRKERLAGAYNRGYLGHQPAHRTCTERSKLVIDRMLEQGQRLTRELAARYSGWGCARTSFSRLREKVACKAGRMRATGANRRLLHFLRRKK